MASKTPKTQKPNQPKKKRTTSGRHADSPTYTEPLILKKNQREEIEVCVKYSSEGSYIRISTHILAPNLGRIEQKPNATVEISIEAAKKLQDYLATNVSSEVGNGYYSQVPRTSLLQASRQPSKKMIDDVIQALKTPEVLAALANNEASASITEGLMSFVRINTLRSAIGQLEIHIESDAAESKFQR